VGLDISKEGIVMASKRYGDSIWIVGDLAKSPFRDKAFHAIVNLLSPSNYSEFKRLLHPGGLVIKAIPRPKYLIELRDELFDRTGKKVYQNDPTVSLFKEHFQLREAIEVSYTQQLSQAELRDIVQMTPLTWPADRDRIETFLDQGVAEITVDVEILVGTNGGKE
jgi:23S rRNA (guanine745-N1)-methyltransferase